ncbi:MAG: O-acetyl-ADP-ribose deacetylase [Chloroflexota bacterium]
MIAKQIEIVQGDITQLKVDAIVNAANNAFSGGGGVDGAIHRAAGPELLAACLQLGRCETGQAKITPGFQLHAKYVIHAVGPVWCGGHKNEENLLASCYRVALNLAETHDVKSIAFPSISTGAYGYPLEQAVKIALESLSIILERSNQFESVLIACFDRQTYRAYQRRMKSSYGR